MTHETNITTGTKNGAGPLGHMEKRTLRHYAGTNHTHHKSWARPVVVLNRMPQEGMLVLTAATTAGWGRMGPVCAWHCARSHAGQTSCRNQEACIALRRICPGCARIGVAAT